MNVLAGIAVKAPGVNFFHILTQLQHTPHAGRPVGTPLRSPYIIARSGARACCIALGVACKARTSSLEGTQLGAVRAQLARLAALALAAALLASLQLPLQQGLLFSQLILRQTLVCSADQHLNHAKAGDQAVLVGIIWYLSEKDSLRIDSLASYFSSGDMLQSNLQSQKTRQVCKCSFRHCSKLA